MPSNYDLQRPTKEIGDAMKQRIDKFYKYVYTYGILGLWRRSYYQYFAGFFNGGLIQYAGQDGELWEISVNDYRNILKHIAILVTSSDVKWDVRSINTDKRSQTQSVLIPSLLEYYERYGGAKAEAYRAVEYCLVYGSGFLKVDWDRMGGEAHDYEQVNGTAFDGSPVLINKPVRTGDPKFKAISPIDVVFDVSLKDNNRMPWIIVREHLSKYDVAALYPEYRDEIEAIEFKYDFMRDLDEYTSFNKSGDTIQVYTLYHSPTPAMPYGRKTVMVSDNRLVVEDGILPYDQIPVTQMTAGLIDRTAFGYSDAFDLLSLQRSADVLTSIVISNQSMFGVQNIAVEEGSGISKEQIERGMNIINVPAGAKPPTVLNLVSTPEAIPRMNQDLRSSMERISGVNSITRGTPDAQITAGNAMALLQAQTIAFSNQLQSSYVTMREKAAMCCLDVIRRNLSVPKAVSIVGMLPGQFINEFTAKDLEGVHRIILDLGNPSTKTAIGRRAMADAMLQYGAIKDPETYVQIATTGNLEVGTNAAVFENLLLKDHEEKLLRGEMPPIIWTDNHQRFINMAINLANMPAIRDNPQLIALVLEYIQKHVEESKLADPMSMAAIGRMPLAGGAPPAGDPAGAPGEVSPQKAGKAAEEQANPLPGIPPGQPMPTNPLTGQEAQPLPNKA